jgi:hypothetical protein
MQNGEAPPAFEKKHSAGRALPPPPKEEAPPREEAPAVVEAPQKIVQAVYPLVRSAATRSAQRKFEKGIITKDEFDQICESDKTYIEEFFDIPGFNAKGYDNDCNMSSGSFGSFGSSIGLNSLFGSANRLLSTKSFRIKKTEGPEATMSPPCSPQKSTPAASPSGPGVSSAQRKFDAGLISKEEFERLNQLDGAYIYEKGSSLLAPSISAVMDLDTGLPPVPEVVQSAQRKLEAGIITEEEFDQICKMDMMHIQEERGVSSLLCHSKKDSGGAKSASAANMRHTTKKQKSPLPMLPAGHLSDYGFTSRARNSSWVALVSAAEEVGFQIGHPGDMAIVCFDGQMRKVPRDELAQLTDMQFERTSFAVSPQGGDGSFVSSDYKRGLKPMRW